MVMRKSSKWFSAKI